MPHSLSNVLVHLVFSTKYRKPTISIQTQPRLHAYVAGTLNAIGCRPIQVGGVTDHIHCFFSLSRVLPMSRVVEEVKTNSSKWMKAHGARPMFAWQNGYGVFSVGRGQVETLIRYIQRQPEHHGQLLYQDEVRSLLDEHGLSYDERYLWD